MMTGKYSVGITLVGSGNLAWHLGHWIIEKGHQINGVVGRHDETVKELAALFRCPWSVSLDAVGKEKGIVILAVDDSQIQHVISYIAESPSLILHTSGSVGIDVFKGVCRNYGVFYPFQTFTRGMPLNYNEIPVCIESSDNESLNTLKRFAGSLSDRVFEMDSRKRSRLHISGIIMNNFFNHLANTTFRFMDKESISKDLIIPLIRETVHKLEMASPEKAQTGPARRNDTDVISRHLDILKNDPELLEIYQFMSSKIIAHYRH